MKLSFSPKGSTLLFLFLFSIVGNVFPEKESDEETVYDQIIHQNMKSFKKRGWSFIANTWYEALVKGLEMQLNPPEHVKRWKLLEMFSNFEKNKKYMNSQVLSDTKTWNDLDMFYGKEDLKSYFSDKVDCTTTDFGKMFLYGELVQPTTDINDLERKQNIIKELVAKEELFTKLELAFKDVKVGENTLLSLWDFDGEREEQFARQAERKTLKKFKFFNKITEYELPTDFINRTGQASTIATLASSTVASVLLPVCGAAAMANVSLPDSWEKRYEEYRNYAGPYFGKILKWISEKAKNDSSGGVKRGLGLASILAGVYCAVHLEQYLDSSKASIYLDICLQKKLINLASAFKGLKDICCHINGNETIKKNLVFFDGMRNFFYGLSFNIKKFLELISSNTFKGKASVFSRHGKTLVAYNLLSDIKDEIGELILAAAEIDFYMSSAKLYKNHHEQDVSYCFAEYKTSETPSVEAEGFWNPFIAKDKVVTNSIKLGTKESTRNAIITGPNAGGKSTALKSLTINLIMAQSLGIAACKSLKFTPFSKIATYLNITDDITKGNSLFQAEVERAQKIIEETRNLKPGEFSFLVMDEVFSGTSPIEGEAAAYSVAKHLGSFNNSICLIATHFPLLTKLSETKNFDNYMVSIERLRSGTLRYPYTLEKGVSNQHAAIDVLRSKGFSGEVVDTAEEILDRMDGFESIID